jgi:hypothetical protein
MPSYIDLTGYQFYYWDVLYAMPRGSNSVRFWCKCKCGTERPVLSNSLLQGKSTNCGCVRRQKVAARNAKHGASVRGVYNATYEAWKHMKSRCLCSTAKDYSYYGGRGVSVCERWINSFEAFYVDMGSCPPKFTLERNDVNRNYEPSNCRWATRKEQTANRRPFKQEGLRGERSSTAKLTSREVVRIREMIGSRSQSAIAQEFGVTQTLISRIKARRA